MKNPFVKPTRETFKNALFYFLLLLISSPFLAIFFTLFSPGVNEATNPSLGECDVYYNEVFYKCVSFGEAIKINFYIAVFVSIVSFFIILFAPVSEGI